MITLLCGWITILAFIVWVGDVKQRVQKYYTGVVVIVVILALLLTGLTISAKSHAITANTVHCYDIGNGLNKKKVFFDNTTKEYFCVRYDFLNIQILTKRIPVSEVS